jgi:uracil-DNA glycosylase family 4
MRKSRAARADTPPAVRSTEVQPQPAGFTTACTRCPRLAAHLAGVRVEFPAYHARPVSPFGDPGARLLIVGLAPGLHGANRTGRPFTGDHTGILLYETLHRFGYGSQAVAVAPDDGLVLTGCRITNAVKCLPPQNKPELREIRQCNHFLAAEVAHKPPRAILALGTIAHQATVSALGLRPRDFAFRHGARHDIPAMPFAPAGLSLHDSYHCSRYNTNTKRLTEAMFHQVFADIAKQLGRS